MTRSRFVITFLLLGIASAPLMGCNAEDRGTSWKKAEGAVMQDREIGYNRDDFRRAMGPRPAAEGASAGKVPDMLPVVAENKKNILPQPLVSITVNQDVPLRDIFYELAKQAEVDLELDPTITGSIIFTAHDRPFDQVVERISEVSGLRYTFKNNVLRVERDTPYMKTYRIDYLGVQRNYTSTINSNTSAASGSSGGGGGGSGGGGSGGGNNGSNSTISVTSNSDFWNELESNIVQIISNTNQQVSLTDQSGPVTSAAAIPALQMAQLAAMTPPPGGTAAVPGTTPAPNDPNAAVTGQSNQAQQAAAASQMAAAAASLAASAAARNNTPPTAGLLNPTGTQNVAGGGTAGAAGGAGGGSGLGAGAGATGARTAYYSVNRQAGLISVFATEKQHKQVSEYLAEMRRAISTQVLIEAKVLEVELNDENSLGIDWELTGRRVTGGVALPQQNFSFDPFTNGNGGILNISTGDFNAVINAISRFGTVRSLASPRLTVMNNQTAVLNVSESRVFFQLEVERTDGTATSGPSRVNITSTVNNVPEGIIITVLPTVDPDTHQIMMNLRPSITRVVRTVSDPGVRIAASAAGFPELESFVPELSIREIDSMVKMNSGGTIVMGGLMQDRTDSRQVGVPVLSEIPVLGAAFRSQRDSLRKTEMVIMLRATVMDNPQPDTTDKDIYKRMGQDRHPLNF